MLFDPLIFVEALFSEALLTGALITIVLSVVVQMAALVLCLPVALGLSARRRYRWPLKTYLWIFRSTPLVLVLLFVWNGLPQLLPALRSDWFSPFLAAAIAMTLVGIAYNAEIMRAALSSVPKGQAEAAAALGLGRGKAFFLVILPQAFRFALPPLMNEFISLLKSTSLAYTISLRELMTVTQLSISASFRFTEWYAAALVYYLLMVSALTLIQAVVERRMAAAYARRPDGAKAVSGRPRTAMPVIPTTSG
ncbi:MAG: amino acid ABC transporter permease [Parvibaculaceae bacterium]